jgi:hypothetical protein
MVYRHTRILLFASTNHCLVFNFSNYSYVYGGSRNFWHQITFFFIPLRMTLLLLCCLSIVFCISILFGSEQIILKKVRNVCHSYFCILLSSHLLSKLRIYTAFCQVLFGL